jgi:hypothetical protein
MSKDNLWKKLHPLLGEARTFEIRKLIETTGSRLDEEAYKLTETEDVIIVTSTKFKDYMHKLCYVVENNTYILHLITGGKNNAQGRYFEAYSMFELWKNKLNVAECKMQILPKATIILNEADVINSYSEVRKSSGKKRKKTGESSDKSAKKSAKKSVKKSLEKEYDAVEDAAVEDDAVAEEDTAAAATVVVEDDVAAEEEEEEDTVDVVVEDDVAAEEEEEEDTVDEEEDTAEEDVQKRGPGRPKKSANTPKRGPGRPKKHVPDTATETDEDEDEGLSADAVLERLKAKRGIITTTTGRRGAISYEDKFSKAKVMTYSHDSEGSMERIEGVVEYNKSDKTFNVFWEKDELPFTGLNIREMDTLITNSTQLDMCGLINIFVATSLVTKHGMWIQEIPICTTDKHGSSTGILIQYDVGDSDISKDLQFGDSLKLNKDMEADIVSNILNFELAAHDKESAYIKYSYVHFEKDALKMEVWFTRMFRAEYEKIRADYNLEELKTEASNWNTWLGEYYVSDKYSSEFMKYVKDYKKYTK